MKRDYSGKKGSRKKKQFVPIGDVLGSKFIGRRMGVLVYEYKIRSLWSQIVGEPLARKTEPWRLFNRILSVNVASSVLSSQLYFLKGEILKKVNGIIGKGIVEDLKFQVREIASRFVPDEKESNVEIIPRPEENFEIPSQVEKTLQGGSFDGETRDILKNILLKAKMVKRKKDN